MNDKCLLDDSHRCNPETLFLLDQETSSSSSSSLWQRGCCMIDGDEEGDNDDDVDVDDVDNGGGGMTLEEIVQRTRGNPATVRKALKQIRKRLSNLDQMVEKQKQRGVTRYTTLHNTTLPMDAYICYLANRYGRQAIYNTDHGTSLDPVKRVAVIKSASRLHSEVVGARKYVDPQKDPAAFALFERVYGSLLPTREEEEEDKRRHRRRTTTTTKPLLSAADDADAEEIARRKFVVLCIDAFRWRMRCSAMSTCVRPTRTFLTTTRDCLNSARLDDEFARAHACACYFVHTASVSESVIRVRRGALKKFLNNVCVNAYERWTVILLQAKRAYELRDFQWQCNLRRLAQRFSRSVRFSLGDAITELARPRFRPNASALRWRTPSAEELRRYNICLCDSNDPPSQFLLLNCTEDEHIRATRFRHKPESVSAKIAAVLFLSDSPFRDKEEEEEVDDDDGDVKHKIPPDDDDDDDDFLMDSSYSSIVDDDDDDDAYTLPDLQDE